MVGSQAAIWHVSDAIRSEEPGSTAMADNSKDDKDIIVAQRTELMGEVIPPLKAVSCPPP